MISSETKIRLRRSGVAGRIPSLNDLSLGELGINYWDGKIFFRQENDEVGARIIEPGQGDNIGNTYFVSVLGNDNNTGLNERDALRSIKKAAQLAQPGDSIKLYPGQYIEDNPIRFRDRVSVEGMELRNVLVTPANPEKDLYQVGEAFHATNHSFVSNVDSRDAAAIITFRPLEGTASDRYFDAGRLIRDNLDFIASETVGFLTSGYSGFAAGQRSQDGARAIELNQSFISEESFQYINSPDYRGPAYVNPDINQCRSDLKDILSGWRYDLISDGNSETTGVGLTYYAPIKFINSVQITDIAYEPTTGAMVIETDIDPQLSIGDEIQLADIRFDCPAYGNDFLISDFVYDNKSGIGTVTVPFFHDVQVNDTIKLDGLTFDCPPYGAVSLPIQNFIYNETSGISRVVLSEDHNLTVGQTIELRDMQFDCPAYGGEFTEVLDLTYDNVAGTGVVYFADAVDLDASDTVYLYDIKMTCPSYGNAISVTGFDYDNITGISEVSVASPHGLQAGDLVKLENLKFSCDSYLDETFSVSNFVYDNTTGNSTITLASNHSYSVGDDVVLNDIVFTCDSYIPSGINIQSFNYDNTTGISTISVDFPHNLSTGDRFRLEDISFACNSYSFTELVVADADYDNVTGFVTLDFNQNHGSEVGQLVRLEGLEYSCVNSGITTNIFPDGTIGDTFEILDAPLSNRLIINVGVSSIQHSYVPSTGTAFVGITTTVFPDGTQGFDFIVSNVVDQFTIETNVGVSTIAHTYDSGGQLFVGFTTTVFPDGTQGDTFRITEIPAGNQITVNVGVSSIQHTFVEGGTVSSIDSFQTVTAFDYNEATGKAIVTLPSDHNLVVGDSFLLEDLKFECDSYRSNTSNTFDITNFQYDANTGLSTITLSSNVDLNPGETIALYDIEFSCINSGITTTIFPDGSVDNFYSVIATPSPNTVITRVGVSSIAHTYVAGGSLQVGITTNIFPDGTRPSGSFFSVDEVPASNQIITDVGFSTIAHTYLSGGKFYTGITTNIFPQTFEDPTPKVVSATYNNITGELSIVSNKPHGLVAGAPVLLQGLEFTCPPAGTTLVFPRNQETYTVDTVPTDSTFTCNIGTSDVAHNYVSGGKITPQNIIDAVYNNVSGDLTVTTSLQHGFKVGDSASVVDLLFSCLSGGPGNAPGNLLFPRPTDEFIVISTPPSSTQFQVNVGAFPSLAHNYVRGGSASFGGVTASVTSASYDQLTGVLTVNTSAPIGVGEGQTVVLQGLEFSCLSGGIGNGPGTLIFPRLDVPSYTVKSVTNNVTYVINVGTSTLAHTYVSGGFSSLKKKANDGNIFRVLGVTSPTTLLTNVGVSSIAHDYVSGGNAFVGITTNVFPDGTRPDNNRFEVIQALTPNSALINIGVSTIPHTYESGGRMQYGETNERQILDFIYNNQTGVSTVTIRGSHGLSAGDNVKFQGMEFECTNSPGITTTIFPDGTAASLNIFPVTDIINNNTFVCNVGRVGFEHTYVQGGSAFVGITTNIFPDGTTGFDFEVQEIVSSREIVVNVGVSSIQHDYIRGGQLFTGRTNERSIRDFNYSSTSGDAIITFFSPEELYTGDLIKLENLKFDCPNSVGITTNIFPDGTRSNLFLITERLNPTQFKLEVGPSPFAHNYVRGTGSAFVGITTNVFPDVGTAPGQQPSKLFNVTSIPAPNQIQVEIGISTITHNYTGGGKLFVGINTDIFPGDPEVSPLGDVFKVRNFTPDGDIVINVGVSSIEHNYVSGWSNGLLKFGQTAGGQLQHITGPGVSEATIAAIDFERQISKSVINNRPWGSFISQETSRIRDVQYDNVSGLATITAPGINVQSGDLIRMSDIQFRCSDEYAGLTTTFFPDNTRPQGQYFTVEDRVGLNTFTTFIGVSSIAHVYNTGGNAYRYNQKVSDIDYTNTTGVTDVTVLDHGLQVGDIIELRDAKFDCSSVSEPTYFIEDAQYTNTTGIMTVTTTLDNDIEIGDRVKLDGIQFECPPYGNQREIVAFDYDFRTGLSEVKLSEPHGLRVNKRTPVGIETASYDYTTGIINITTVAPINFTDILTDGVSLAGLAFTCPNQVKTVRAISNAEYNNTSGIVRITTDGPHGAIVNRKVKLEGLNFECSSNGGAPTLQAFPSGVDGYDFYVTEIIASNIYEAQVGVSTIVHTYVNSGTSSVGITTTIFPEKDLVYKVKEITSPTEFSAFVGETFTDHIYTGGGTAARTNRNDVKLADIKFDCPAYGNDIDVVDFLYDNTTGNSLITVAQPHNLELGENIKLADIEFLCNPYDNNFDVLAADYDNTSGIITITTSRNLTGLKPGNDVRIKHLQFDCDSGTEYNINNVFFAVGSGIATIRLDNEPAGLQVGDPVKLTGMVYTAGSGTTFAYPDGRDPSLNIFQALKVEDANVPGLDYWNVTVQFPLVREAFTIFNNEGTLITGITTNIFPENVGPAGQTYEVLSLPSANQLSVQVGTSTIPHTYIRYGEVFTGVTTSIFPDSSPQNSPFGNIFPVLDIPTANQVRINVGLSSITHIYESGGSLLVGITTNIFPDGTQGDIFPVVGVTSTDSLLLNVGVSTIPHNYVSGGELFVGVTTNIFPGNTQNSPRGSIYEVIDVDTMCGDQFTVNVGPSSISHNYVDGGTVTTGVTTDKFPDGTFGFRFEIQQIVDNNNFRINVGTSTIPHTYNSGGNVRRIDNPINNFIYDNTTGIATVVADGHKLNVGDIVKLRDIKFDCDPYGGEKTIVGFNYNNITGRAVVETSTPHSLVLNQDIKLSGIQMDCDPYNNTRNIDDVVYQSNTGILFVRTTTPHGLANGDDVKLADLFFNCTNSGITTNIFPDGTAPSLNIYQAVPTDALNFQVNVGVSSINHTWQPGTGQVFVGVTTNIFPGDAQNSPKGSIFNVLDTPTINSFTIDVGVSSIRHNYVRGGLVQAGVTTDLFPDGTQGDFFLVNNVLDENVFEINTGISSITHRYNSGGYMSKYSTYQSKQPQIIDKHVIRVSGDCQAVGARVDQLAGIVTSIIENGPTAAPGSDPVRVTGASYSNVSGLLSITVDTPISVAPNDNIEIENLIFRCSKTANVAFATYDNVSGKTQIRTATPHGVGVDDQVTLDGLVFDCGDGQLTYPSNPSQVFFVTEVIDSTNYVIKLETSTKVHNYVSGGVSRTVPSDRIFPDNKVTIYPVVSVVSPINFSINVGPSDIPHNYVSGGTVKPGLRFEVSDSTFDTVTGELVVTTLDENFFVAETGVKLNGLRFECPSGGPNNQPGSLLFPDGRPANVTGSVFNEKTGLLQVTTDKPHQLYRDAKVRLEGLVFSCPAGGGIPAGSLTYPENPDKLLRVSGVVNAYTYEVQLTPSDRVHTYVEGGISDAGSGNYRIARIINPTTFVVEMAPNSIPHTYIGGGTAAGVFTEQEFENINLRTQKCADDVKKIYLAIVHDVTRGGNMKSVNAAKLYFDSVGQYQHIAGGEVNQTVAALEFSKNIVRCVINNVTWGGVPRGYFTQRERLFIPTASDIAGGNNAVPFSGRARGALSRDLLRLVDMPPSTTQSVVAIGKPFEKGQYTTEKKFIDAFEYDNVSGIASVTTTQAHRLIKYDAIRLRDIQMRCIGSPRLTTNIFPDGTQGEIFEVLSTIQDNPIFPVLDAEYNNTTGEMVVTSLSAGVDMEVGTLVNLRNLRFECSSSGAPGVLVYPTNNDYVYEVIRTTEDSITVNVGVSTLAHTFIPITTGLDVPQFQELPKKFRVHVGTVGFPHIYESGGTVWKMEPFSTPGTATQLRDVSIQNDPTQNTNSTPNACANVFSAITNAVGVVTTIIDVGFEESGISVRYPGNDGKGVDNIEEMSSQGVGNIIKGPYIRNCTNFVPKSIGMRMDGFDAEPGDEISNGVQGSSNVDSFTQFNPGGIGCSISNGTYQQLVSIFTICCDEAITCDSGAQLDLTNSNSSFGRLGLVARGIGDSRSKSLDRYTGIVAEESLIEDDTVIIRGVGNKRPYDGQGVFFGELYYEVTTIEVTDGGSGYDDENPPFASVAEPTGPSGIKAEVSPTVRNGVIVSIEVIANGNQYLERNPTITIDPPRDPNGRRAEAVANTQPLYYDIDSASESFEGTTTVVFKQRLNNTVSVGTTVFFSRLSLQIASSHSFQYIGAGNSIDGARPSQGGVPIKENEVVMEEGGSVIYTSTDQAGNFNIGDDFVINQFTGTVTGRSFDQSVLNKVTPLIIALDS